MTWLHFKGFDKNIGGAFKVRMLRTYKGLKTAQMGMDIL